MRVPHSVLPVVLALVAVSCASCDSGRGLVINELVEARGLAADIRSGFLRAADKSSQAVMAETDEESIAAAHEAEDTLKDVDGKIARLQTLVKQLSFQEESRQLDALQTKYSEYKQLDEQIRALAIENSNLKAQRLVFGPGRDSLEAVRTALASAVSKAPPRLADRAHAVAAETGAALLEIELIEGRHIAESEDAPMTEMERKMDALAATVAGNLDALTGLVGKNAAADLAAAKGAFERFKAVHAEIIQMSRRNTNVRSLALTLGRKRTLAAACDDAMVTLSNSLAKHQFTATR